MIHKRNIFKAMLISGLALFTLGSCDNDDNDDDFSISGYTVTIENVFEPKEYFSTEDVDAIPPSSSVELQFNAGSGHYLSFASMIAQTNDIFIGTSDTGVKLYSDEGVAVTGDITSSFYLWDAGTEVNEEPGVGESQAPRQGVPNSGIDENGVVQLLSNVNDGFTYPSVSELISVSLAHDGGSLFTITITNKSESSSLEGPFAPGIWVVHEEGKYPLFYDGQEAATGLEAFAEDGNNAILYEDVMANSGYVSPFAPGTYSDDDDIFEVGEVASNALEGLAEDGNVSGYNKIFNTPVSASEAGPIFPGDSYSFNVVLSDDNTISFATMLIQSNDWFIGAEDLSIYKNGRVLIGDITKYIKLYDAGTEADEYPGAGMYQAPRQPNSNTGDADSNYYVREVKLPYNNVPKLSKMVKVTVSPY